MMKVSIFFIFCFSVFDLFLALFYALFFIFSKSSIIFFVGVLFFLFKLRKSEVKYFFTFLFSFLSKANDIPFTFTILLTPFLGKFDFLILANYSLFTRILPELLSSSISLLSLVFFWDILFSSSSVLNSKILKR